MIALLLLLAVVTGSVGIVYLGANLYFKHKEQLWLAYCEASEAVGPTEEEKLIGDEWKQTAAEACVAEEVRVAEEIKVAVKLPVKNPASIPMPTKKNMVGITFQQAVEHEQTFGPGTKGFLGVDETGKCVICGKMEDHFHLAAEVNVHIEREARSSFEKHVENMDLTQLNAEAIEKLFIRCKARIAEMTTLEAMKRLDNVYGKALQIAREEEEDEEFYRQACEDAKLEQPVVVPPKGDLDSILSEVADDIFEITAKPVKKIRRKKPVKKATKKLRKRK